MGRARHRRTQPVPRCGLVPSLATVEIVTTGLSLGMTSRDGERPEANSFAMVPDRGARITDDCDGRNHSWINAIRIQKNPTVPRFQSSSTLELQCHSLLGFQLWRHDFTVFFNFVSIPALKEDDCIYSGVN
ncbi:hypothetical protein TIFTF001_017514 [Ficus carica]|uniref:Uncharacterized protein n=1 Tax=Ficus carica TaxID=3494 RepID=A0AA88A2F3_FICCA|nr:hypothetical protein TIFTF001_017514 [Ficus carica]